MPTFSASINPGAMPVLFPDVQSFGNSTSYSELYPKTNGHDRLHMSTCGELVRGWSGRVLDGPEIAIAVETSHVMDHHTPYVRYAAASNGTQRVIIASSDLAKFLYAHRTLGFIVANADQTWWILKECCSLAGVESDFLWDKIRWGLCDVVLLDTLRRMPRPPGELIVPRTIHSIATELAGVHTLPPALRTRLSRLLEWRKQRAEMDHYGFLAGEAEGVYLAVQLFRQMGLYGQSALFRDAREQFGKFSLEIMQRMLQRASIASRHIFANGLACDTDACVNHKSRLLAAAGEVAEDLRKNRVTKALFPTALDGEANSALHMDGSRLIKIMTAVQGKYSDLPEVPHPPGGVEQIDPMLVSLYGEYEPALKKVALFRMDLRLYDDMQIGEDGRLRLRNMFLPQTQQQISAFDYLLQQGYSRLLRVRPKHALLLVCVTPGSEMHPDLVAALTLSASLELTRRGYRIVAHTEGSLVIEAEGEQLTDASQCLVETVIAEHLGLFVKQPDHVVVACRRVSGFEEIENYLLKDEARAKLGRPPFGA